jgi:Bacterial Ig-like domain (group 1)/PKD domain
MDIKMLDVFMVTRLSYRVLVAALAACSLFVVACEKVPLLAPTGSTITLTASTTALPVNGATQLIAQIIEAGGTPPHTGTHVIFTTSLGTIEPPEIETDINGRAVVIFKAGTANGTATITASSGGASVSGANAVKIAVGTAAVGRVVVAATPTVIPAQGGSAAITAAVYDINGNPLPSAPVSFSTTAGTLDLAVANTDGNGVASATLRTSTAATVTASVGATGGSSTGTPPPTTGTPTPTPPASSGQATGSITVNVAGSPTLVITPPTAAPTAGLPSTFTFVVTAAKDNASPIRDLVVNWGDGFTQSLGAVTGTSVVAHTYRSAGSYTISGTVTDSFGTVVTVSSAVIVNPTALTLTITPPANAPSANLPAVFTIGVGTLPPGDAVRNIHLEWGDGTSLDLGAISGNTAVSKVYKTPGTFIITGTLTDTAGNSITNSTTVTIIPVPRPTIIITPSPVPGHVGAQTTLTIQVQLPSGISVQDLSINFGDGQTADLGGATSASVPHVYTSVGSFTVTVTVVDTSGQTTIGTAVVSIAL